MKYIPIIIGVIIGVATYVITGGIGKAISFSLASYAISFVIFEKTVIKH